MCVGRAKRGFAVMFALRRVLISKPLTLGSEANFKASHSGRGGGVSRRRGHNEEFYLPPSHRCRGALPKGEPWDCEAPRHRPEPSKRKTGHKDLQNKLLFAWSVISMMPKIGIISNSSRLPRAGQTFASAKRRISRGSATLKRHRPEPSKRKKSRKDSFFFWSGLRGSNPPPPPWQGGALPNELNPRVIFRGIGDSDGARTHDL